MNTDMNCQEVRERIAGMTDGWLGPEDIEQVVSHISRCQACRKETELDLRLVEAIRQHQENVVPAMRWDSDRPRRSIVWKLAWFSPVALAAVLATVLWRSSPIPNRTMATAVVSSDSQALDHAHMALTLSDAGSDPNRAILAAFAKAPSKEQMR